MPTLAHASHWLVNLMYVAPVFVIIGWVGIQSIRDRRNGESTDDRKAP